MVLAIVAAPVAHAEGESESEVETEVILVVDQRPVTASSDRIVRAQDFKYFPRRSASDLMRLVPGLHITQHTGGAKAHQIFLRGFDAEHGQDVAGSLDGVPLNEVSHVHGQGYLDLHFLIPEVIRRIRILKGPYDGGHGSFATAGSIDFITVHQRPYTASAGFGPGMFNTYSMLSDLSLGSEESGLYFAFQGERSDGYTDPGRLDALRAFARGRAAFTGGWILDVLYAGYRARSRAADVVPESWIRQGRIGRFGSLDKSNRVDVDRHLAGLTLRGPAGGGWLRATGYYNFKDTRIFSNYTYYYFNEDLGDQIEQSDFRHYGGLHTAYTRADSWAGVGELVSDWGIQWRMDAIRQTQANTVERVRFNLMNHYRIYEHNLGFYAQEKLLLGERWMLVGAVRYDLNLIDVNGTQDVRELDIYTNRVVVRQEVPRDAFAHAHAVSPKLSAVCSVSDRWKAFLNFGRGFVTRPARDQANRQEAFSYAVTGAELGTHWSDRDGKVGVSGGVWWMHKDRELVFDSEFGGTVFRGQSHRVGLEIELRYAPFSWAYLATDLSYIHARLDSGSGWTVVPNTPSLLMTNVLAVQLEEGLHASLRGRLLGSREHDLGMTSPAYYVMDLVLAYAAEDFEITLEVDNLLDADWYDSVFAYPVRPAPGEPIDAGLQVTPGTPFFVRFCLTFHV